MSRFDRRAGFVMLLLAVATGDASAAKTVTPKVPGTMPRIPAPLGWPHAILTANSGDCSREPGPNEVLVTRDGNFKGTCAVLTPGFYPFPSNLLVGNDSISSIKVGAAVRARAFTDQVSGGAWSVYMPGTRSAGLGDFNDKISSMRIEPADRSQTCDDLREGEIALFQHEFLAGDCVVLPGNESYANPETMGIGNDRISSVRNNSARRMITYWHQNFGVASEFIEAHTVFNAFSRGGATTDGNDDDISSVQMCVVDVLTPRVF
jgi:hypothetical protein